MKLSNSILALLFVVNVGMSTSLFFVHILYKSLEVQENFSANAILSIAAHQDSIRYALGEMLLTNPSGAREWLVQDTLKKQKLLNQKCSTYLLEGALKDVCNDLPASGQTSIRASK